MRPMIQIDKENLMKEICLQLEKDLKTLKAAALATYEAATSEESKAENEYDTRGLEASYLAGAQAKRVQETEEQLAIYQQMKIRTFDSTTPIGATALVETENDGKRNLLFVMLKGGGMVISFAGHRIQVVTPTSPLGEALIGLKTGDVAVIDAGAHTREFEILGVY